MAPDPHRDQRAEGPRRDLSLDTSSQDVAAEDWRLYSLFRSGAIFVHVYSPARGARPVRLSVAGLGEAARAALCSLGCGQRVPPEIAAALFRLNRIC